MREENNLEKSVNKKFSDFQLAIPEDLWSKIEANLDGDKKKRKAISFWKLFGGSLCLIGICVAAVAWRTSNLDATKVSIESTSQADSNANKNRMQQSNLILNKSSLTNSNRFDNKEDDQTVGKKQVVSESKKLKQDFKNQAKIESKTNSEIDSKKYSAKSDMNFNTRSIARLNQNNVALNKPVLYAENLMNTKENVLLDGPKEIKKPTKESTNQLDVNVLAMRKANLIDVGFEEKTPKHKYNLQTPKNSNSFWSISASASVSDNFRKLDIPDEPALRTHRNQNEKQFISLAYQLQVERTFRSFMFGVGYGYAKKGELYSFTSNQVNHNSKNFYSYNQFQIGLAKRFVLKNKFLVVPGVRTNFNFLKRAHASWVDPNTSAPITHNSGALSPFRNQLISGEFYLELVTSYKHFEYFITPKFNMMFQSVYRKEVAIKQYPFAVELGFGLRYKL